MAVATNQKKVATASSGASVTLLTGNVLAGSWVVVIAATAENIAPTVASGGILTAFTTDRFLKTPINNAHGVGIYSAKVITPGPCTITITPSGAQIVRGFIYEVINLDPTNPVGASNSGTGTGLTANAGTITPDNNDGFCVCGTVNDGSAGEVFTPGSGWTFNDSFGSSVGNGQSRIVASTANITGDTGLSNSLEWSSVIVNYHSTIIPSSGQTSGRKGFVSVGVGI